MDEILNYNSGSPNLTSNRMVASTDNAWYAKYWLGELYPDSYFSVWQSSGNLPTGTGKFYRAAKSTFLTHDSTNRTGAYGCAAFFNGKPASRTGPFMHISVTATGTITDLGLDISTVLNYPLAYQVSSPRPYTINYGGNYPPSWSDAVYSAIRPTLSMPRVGSADRVYYTSDYSSAYTASGLVQLDLNSKTAFVTVSGLSTQVTFGSSQLNSYALLSMMRSFLDAGLYTGSAHIMQLPYVVISSPAITDEFNSAASVPIAWGSSWKRWDGQAYTEDYSASYFESTPVQYIAKYSGDNGSTWKHCADGSSTLAGKYSSAYAQSGTSLTWSVTGLPKGAYVVRVEAFRPAIGLHYAYDQVSVYLRN